MAVASQCVGNFQLARWRYAAIHGNRCRNSNQAITWSLNPPTGACTFSTGRVYTAPSTANPTNPIQVSMSPPAMLRTRSFGPSLLPL